MLSDIVAAEHKTSDDESMAAESRFRRAPGSKGHFFTGLDCWMISDHGDEAICHNESMEWTGSIRWIHNPVQSRRIWTGLDQKFTNSADSGLDWIQKCAMCTPYLDLRQFLLIVTLTSEVLPSNLQLFTSSFVFTCRFYKVFARYLLCCVRIGLDWIQILVHQLDWTGLGSEARGFGLDWIVLTRSISYSAVSFTCHSHRNCLVKLVWLKKLH